VYEGIMTQPHPRAVTDIGTTHIALPVSELQRSLDFYQRYADMQVVHQRTDPHTGKSVAWISDLTRPFVLVLIEAAAIDHTLGGVYCHIGRGVGSRDEVDRLIAQAHAEGRTVVGPMDYGYPVGYWAYIADPDGHNLEVSFGQEVGLTVEAAKQS